MDRFRAKASKARQAQSKLKLIEKMAEGLVALPGSSRRYPTFRFGQCRPSGKEVVRVEGVRKAFGDNEVLHGVDLEVRRGERVAILGPNGIGKSTLLKILVGALEPDAGAVTWGYETHVGYFAQDHHEAFDDPDRTAETWLWDFCPGRDRGFVRAQMGLVLFSGDDGAKKVGTLSGGEAARLIFARLMMEEPNVLVLDEPTNHLDLESIEALVVGLADFPGTLILVSHDRWFVSRLATRIVEITADGVRDYPGSYEEYVHACGDDHLDADTAALHARAERRARRREAAEGRRRGASRREAPRRRERPEVVRRRLERERDEITAAVEAAESRIAAIDEAFCAEGFYERTSPDEVAALQAERAEAEARLEKLLAAWERVEEELAGMDGAAGA